MFVPVTAGGHPLARHPVRESIVRWLITRAMGIHEGDGTGLAANGFSEVRKGDGTVLWTAIPDSVVSRDPDDASNTADNNVGIEFSTSQEWKDFQAKLSSNQQTASDEEMVIETTAGAQIATKDISTKTSLDVVTFSGVGLAANEDYFIYCQTSNSRQYGFNNTQGSYPYTSSDGDLQITGGYNNGAASFSYGIITIGNINL